VPEVGYANVAVQPQVVAGLAGIGYIQVDAMCTCDRKVAAAWALCQSGCGAADASPSHGLGAVCSSFFLLYLPSTLTISLAGSARIQRPHGLRDGVLAARLHA
jgi:hypothetical protein